jgi:hypothetical protein
MSTGKWGGRGDSANKSFVLTSSLNSKFSSNDVMYVMHIHIGQACDRLNMLILETGPSPGFE